MLRDQLRRDVEALCAHGPRNTWNLPAFTAAARFIEESLAAAGYRVERQVYDAAVGGENLIAELAGGKEIVVVGAHYDSIYDSPGADDNASGVAGMLALARHFAGKKRRRTLRFIAFANEEPPYFTTPAMGSLAYASRCHERGEGVAAMLSLEMLGYFDDARGSQQYPPPLSPFYPDTGNFIALAGNIASRALIRRCSAAMRRHGGIPVESAVLPAALVPQAGWSDQWSFWQFGWPALMVTDTALFRNPHYHDPDDTPDTLDYERMARVVEALIAVVEELT